MKIGIMQGRLSPPTDGKFQSFPKYSWQEEFIKARRSGLSNIEWIFEADGCKNNPISTDEGIRSIIGIIMETGISVQSICADYFMDIPYLLSAKEARFSLRKKLNWLIEQANKLGVKYIDLPFVDNSSIQRKENFHLVYEFIEPIIETARKNDVIIALETDLNPSDFKLLLEHFNSSFVMANYDTGNSSGIGYNCQEELQSYGKWIKTIHIKDRLFRDGTKPLGTGSADFNLFFQKLAKLDFDGPIILQAAREPDEENTAIKNRIFVEKYLEEYSIS